MAIGEALDKRYGFVHPAVRTGELASGLEQCRYLGVSGLRVAVGFDVTMQIADNKIVVQHIDLNLANTRFDDRDGKFHVPFSERGKACAVFFVEHDAQRVDRDANRQAVRATDLIKFLGRNPIVAIQRRSLYLRPQKASDGRLIEKYPDELPVFVVFDGLAPRNGKKSGAPDRSFLFPPRRERSIPRAARKGWDLGGVRNWLKNWRTGLLQRSEKRAVDELPKTEGPVLPDVESLVDLLKLQRAQATRKDVTSRDLPDDAFASLRKT